MTKLHVAYSPLYQDWQLGIDHPTNPVRAEIAVALLEELVPDLVYHDPDEHTEPELEKALGLVHDPNYVDKVLTDYEFNGQVEVPTAEVADAALSMFGGTYALVKELERLEWAPGVYFNPQGAKHHAAWDHMAGFCAFNDMAWAARYLAGRELAVGYLDWDAHAGDGVQDLTKDTDAVTYFSIHQGGIYPGQAWTLTDAVGQGVYNRVLEAGAGDDLLLAYVDEALEVFHEQGVDVVLLAAGADGLREDPLTGLCYTIPGLYKAAQKVGAYASKRGLPIVVGGAGGYTPLKETPIAWAGVVTTLHKELNGQAA